MSLDQPTHRKPYRSPKLQIYGDIRQLTQATNTAYDFDNLMAPPATFNMSQIG